MWSITFIVIFIIVLILLTKREEDHLSKMVALFFSSFWFVSLIVSSFNPLGLYPVSDIVYFILLVDALCFLFGFSIVKVRPLYSGDEYVSQFEYSLKKVLNNKILIVIAILCTILVVSTARKQMALLAIDANEMSGIAQGENDILFQSPLLSIVYNVFIPVVFHVFLCLFPYLLLNKKNKIYALFAGLFIISRALIGGSRDSIFIIVVYFVVSFFMRGITTRKKEKKRKNRFVQILLIIALCAGIYFVMVFLTSLRHGNDELNKQTYTEYSEGLQQSFVNYACGPFRAFDYGLEHNYYDYAGGPLLGRSTFSGLEDFLQLFANRVGIDLCPISEKTVQHQQDIRISVSPSFNTFNYAYTNAMIFYYDGGIIAVIFFSFLFGLIMRLAIRMLYRNMTLPAVFLVGFLFFGIYKSTFTWFMIKQYAWLYVIILLLWHQYETRKSARLKRLKI